MPVHIERLPDGKYMVSHGGKVSAKATTLKKALAQKRLILAASNGWRPGMKKSASQLKSDLIEKVAFILKASKDHWIQDMHMHKGLLHKELGVPSGKKIPEGKLEAAENSRSPKIRRQAHVAETLKRIHG